MSKSLIARAGLAALMTTMLVPFADCAFAQSEGRSTADIEKENAALRAKVHRLEAQNENAGLRAKLDQLRGRQPVQLSRPAQVATPVQASQPQIDAGAPSPLVTRIEVASPDRTLVMADLPVKAAPMPPPIYSWTGFYIGGNVGYSVGSDRTVGSLITPGITAVSPGYTIAPAGVIGGGQFGYNFQVAPNWLFGFEADFQGSQQKSNSCFAICEVASQPVTNGTVSQVILPTTTHTLDYFGTVRGRIGYVEGSALFYVTGGGAYGRVNQNVDFTNSFNSPGPPAVNSAISQNISTIQNKFGFTVGAGAEASIGGNWTAKIEYLYIDLGTIGPTILNSAAAGNPPSPAVLTATSKIHDNIVRAGLNYRLGAPAGPVSAYNAMAAVPPPIYNWTGFYVGANAGYGFGQGRHETDGVSDIGGTLAPITSAGSDITPKGFVGGAQVGYNWQGSPNWLIGFEADLQGSAIKDTTCVSIVCFNGNEGTDSGTNTVNLTHQIDWFSTVRGRLGFVADNNLFYVTGGAAFAHVKQTIVTNSSLSTGGIFQTDSSATDMIGYVVGGGIERMIWGGWSAKAEYLYMNLGDLQFVNTLGTPPTTLTLTTNSNVREHIVRVGANYHFTAGHY